MATGDENLPQRRITLRHLARYPSKVVDEIEERREPILVLRYGRPVAIITPFGATSGAAPSAEPEEPEEMPELSATEQLALRAIADGGRWETFMAEHDVPIGAALAAMTGLELAGLVERTFAGYRLTRRGMVVARRMSPLP